MKRIIWLAFGVFLFLSLAPGHASAENPVSSPFISIKDHLNHWGKEDIQNLLNMGVITGSQRTDGTWEFRPDDQVTRAQFATLAVKALDLPMTEGEIGFRDVPQNHWGYAYIGTAKRAGIISGIQNPDGSFSFQPDAPITRAQMAQIIMNATDTRLVLGKEAKNFPDVPAGAWMAAAVEKATRADVISGYPNGTFGANDHATRAQAATVLIRTLQAMAAESSLPLENTLTKLVLDFENAGLKEINHEQYAFTESLKYCTGLAEYVTRQQAAKFAEEAKAGTKLLITADGGSQNVQLLDRRSLTAKVSYTYVYLGKVTINGQVVAENVKLTGKFEYKLRRIGGQWKIYDIVQTS